MTPQDGQSKVDLMADLEASLERRPGYDMPLPNGCWKCIGCGVILSPKRDWNQCSNCDTRTPEDY